MLPPIRVVRRVVFLSLAVFVASPVPGSAATDPVPADLKRRVDAGDKDAMFELGEKYEWSWDPIPMDPKKALELYAKAAEKGHVEAGVRAGRIHLEGRGVTQSAQNALPFLKRAAEAGNVEAQYFMGQLYREGGKLKRDDDEALKWFVRAAEGGDSGSVLEVALAFRYGRGVKQDLAAAAGWMQLAVEMGVGANGDTFLDEILSQDPKYHNVPAQPQSALKDLSKIVAAAKLKSAETATAAAPTPQVPAADPAKPRDYSEYGAHLPAHIIGYIKKAEAGEVESELWLARCFLSGIGGIRKDATQALAWFQRGVDRGETKSMIALSELYADGTDDPRYPKQPTEALKWMRKAADAGDVGAMMNLASNYASDQNSYGLARSDAEAFQWYLRAAEKGSDNGQYSVGVFYHDGRGVARNLPEAAKWLAKAAPTHPAARDLLARIGPAAIPIGSPDHPWTKLAREFEAAFNRAKISESREEAVKEFSKKIGYESGGASKAQMSEFVLTTLKPYLERNPGEAGMHVLAINSLAFEQRDIQRLLPANVQASVKAYAQQVTASFNRSQQVGTELNQLENAARSGGVAQKLAVADRYLRESQGQGSTAYTYRTKALYWLRQAAQQGDKTRANTIASLEDEFEDQLELYQQEKLGWQAYYLCKYMADAGYGGAAKEAGLYLLIGRDGVGRNVKGARELFEQAVSLGDAFASRWLAYAKGAEAAALDANFAFQNGESVAVGKDGRTPNWHDARAWFELAQSLGHAKAADRMKEVDELKNVAATAPQPGGPELQEGNAAFDAKDYAKAYERWKVSADKGSPDAFANIGYAYEYGYGVEGDLLQAKEWYLKAKARGFAKADELIASAEQRIARGGLEFEAGSKANAKEDFAGAFKAWTAGAAKGNSGAMYNLGALSQNGQGVKQNYVAARDWYLKAAAAGMEQGKDAAKAIEDAIAKGAQDSIDGSAAYEAKNYEEALRLFTLGAHKGHSYAAYNLGLYYEEGRAGKTDRAKAIEWYEKAAAMGNPDAKAAADAVRKDMVGGDEFDKGKAAYDAKKFTEAVSWYEKSANLGNVRAMATLGSFYQDGAGEIFGDRTKAKFWLRKAVEKGDGISEILLKSIEDSDFLAAMVPKVNEGPAKGPSLVKGSPWTGADILASLRQGADHLSLAIAMRTDGAELFYGDTVALELDPAAAKIVEHGRLSQALAAASKPVGGQWAWDLAKAAIAARKAQLPPPAPRPEDSISLRAKAGIGDPAAAYALYRMRPEEFKLGNLEGPLARSYNDMAKLAMEKDYAPALWIAAGQFENQVDKTKNNPVLHAEYLRRSAEAGEIQAMYQYAKEFFAPGDDVAVAPNLAEAEYWFIEAGAREQEGDFSFMKPDFALALLYSMKPPIGFQGTEARAEESSLRWAQELIRRGGPAGEHAKRIVEKWRRDKRSNPAVLDSLVKNLAPEVAAFPEVEVKKLDAAARGGDPAAALKLARANATGRGVRQNDARAVELYRLAAAKGSREAMRALAYHSEKGFGTKRDAFERLAWLEKAGAAGDAQAWREAGDLYQFGTQKGDKVQDFTKALAAYQKAVEGGDAKAYVNYSLLYELGRGVPKDEAKVMELLKAGAEKGDRESISRFAYKLKDEKNYAGAAPWFEKAIAAGDENVHGAAAETYRELNQYERAVASYRKRLEKFPNDFQSTFDLAETQEKMGDFRGALKSYERVTEINNQFNTFKNLAADRAAAMAEELDPKPGSFVALRKQAEKGDVEAMMQVVMKLAQAKNTPAALEWLKKAADKEHPPALLMLGLETYKTDKAAGLALVEKAAVAGNAEAKFRFGGVLLQGTERTKDVARGVKLITEAADSGFAPAQIEFGRALIVGTPFVTAEPARGIAYLKKAAEQRVPQASALLGEAYENGVGVAADLPMALRLYEEAQRGGIKEAAGAISRVRQKLSGKGPPPASEKR